MSKKPRRSKDRIKEIKHKLCKIWGRFIYKKEPIPTIDVFEKLGYNYYNTSDRENIYRYNRECQEEAETLWDTQEILEGDKERVFRIWLDKCHLKDTPYIILEDGSAYTPKTYEEWELAFGKIVIKKIFGLRKVFERMAKKDMKIRGILVKSLLLQYNQFLKLLPKKEEKKAEEEEWFKKYKEYEKKILELNKEEQILKERKRQLEKEIAKESMEVIE